MNKTGVDLMLDMLADAGVHYLFGNPGTTELPLNDALVDDERFRYVLGLQEVPVMAMADGYAMASGKLGVVNLHISCGLGNAMGMLYNAYREGTPLLVTAGQTDRRLRLEEPILWGEMVDVARPWTKMAAEVRRLEDLPTLLRRAIEAALTPPTGPTFLSIPVDIQMELTAGRSLDLSPPTLHDRRVRPPADALGRAADVLLAAKRPGILAGSRVVEAGALAEIVAVAERLGAEAISESGTTHGRLGFPCDHPLYGQGLPLWSPDVRERLAEFDALLVVGMDLLRQYVYHEPARAIPEHIKLVHLDEDPRQLGKNYRVEVGLIGDVRTGLAELDAALAERSTAATSSAAQARFDRIADENRERREQLIAEIDSQRTVRPMTPATAMHAIARALNDDVAVVEEAVTTTNTTLERLGAIRRPDGYFGHRGWALGWGLGVALGVQLAWPDRPTLGILGEGAAMYGVQGLWTAAHQRIGATFVICNNAQYQILKIGAKGMDLPRAKDDRFLGLDIVDPPVDMVALARSLGVDAVRVDDPDQLTAAVAESLASDAPKLIDAPIGRSQSNRLEYG